MLSMDTAPTSGYIYGYVDGEYLLLYRWNFPLGYVWVTKGWFPVKPTGWEPYHAKETKKDQ